MKTQRRIVPDVTKEILLKSHCIVRGTGVREIEVRDLIVAVDGMLGLAAAQNPMRMKQTGAKPSQIERRIIAKQT
jgi:hypothetical protein